MDFSKEQGQQLIAIARGVISSAFQEKGLDIPADLKEILVVNSGVFVTLYKDNQLRGCIGIPEPNLPLGIALVKAARSAAFEDPRFPSLEKGELREIKIEVSVLTPPEKIEVKLDKIKVGQDGLIVHKGERSGLLLPQVAKEFGWSAEEFLSQTCIKAGLSSDAWKTNDLEVYRFQAQIFKE